MNQQTQEEKCPLIQLQDAQVVIKVLHGDPAINETIEDIGNRLGKEPLTMGDAGYLRKDKIVHRLMGVIFDNPLSEESEVHMLMSKIEVSDFEEDGEQKQKQLSLEHALFSPISAGQLPMLNDKTVNALIEKFTEAEALSFTPEQEMQG